MQQAINNTFMSAIQRMLSYCKDIQALLQQDRDSFKANDINVLNDSNEKKSIVIGKLTALVNEMQDVSHSNQSGNLFAKIEKQATDLNQTETIKLVNELKLQISNCYQSIATNNQIVSANIHQFKQLADKLLSLKADMACVYDHKGETK